MIEVIRAAGELQTFCEAKAFADRSRDWADLEGIIICQIGKLDWTHIGQQLGPLAELKETPEILSKLEKLRLELES